MNGSTRARGERVRPREFDRDPAGDSVRLCARKFVACWWRWWYGTILSYFIVLRGLY